jgi:hypothetical protein
MNTLNQLVASLPRREIFAFTQWMKSLPKEQTVFLYQTFDAEEVRVEKLKDLYKRYQTEKSKKFPSYP